MVLTEHIGESLRPKAPIQRLVGLGVVYMRIIGHDRPA